MPFEDVLSIDSAEDALTVAAVRYGTYALVQAPVTYGCSGLAAATGPLAVVGVPACVGGGALLAGWLRGQVYDEVGYEMDYTG